MNNRQQLRLESYKRVLSRCDDGELANVAEVPPIIARLRVILAEIQELANHQQRSRRANTMTIARAQLDRMRLKQMLPLATLVRPLFEGETAVTKALVVPHMRAPADELFQSAKRMVAALRPHRAFLRKSNIDPARIDSLHQEAARVKKIIKEAEGVNADKGTSAPQLRDLLTSAHTDVKSLLALAAASDENTFHKSVKQARKIRKRMGRPRVTRPPKSD